MRGPIRNAAGRGAARNGVSGRPAAARLHNPYQQRARRLARSRSAPDASPPRPAPLALLTLALAACGPEARTDAGAVAIPTSTVVVDYRGTLADGTVFDEAEGARFALAEVIGGFRTGIAGMHVGETKTLVVPPEEGYGAAGAPPDIPPNATLTFVVTLRGVAN